jgi:hypothetical protein
MINPNQLKKIYFATICWPPPLLLVVYPLVFVWRWDIIPYVVISYYPLYFAVGLIFVLLDLWWSEHSVEFKWLWTALNLCVGVICLPIYWWRYISKEGTSERVL